MSENEQDNKNFEFIKEQVIEKKHKKVKKWLLPLLMTVGMAILFGMIAAVTFVVAEPRLYKFLHKEEEIKTPVSFPTKYPEDSGNGTTDDPIVDIDGVIINPSITEEDEKKPETETVIVEQSIDADMEDFVNMYDEIRLVASEANKCLVNVSSIITVKDWFGNPIERSIDTTGVVIANNNADLLILVSLDRIKDASSIKIVFSEKVIIDAVLQDYESEINLAVIAIPITDIPPVYMNNLKVATFGESYSITVGSLIFALGSPNGHPGSMDIGIISSRGSWASITDNKLDLFNTNINVNNNSDGIIVNLNGEVIGLITRTLRDEVNAELNTELNTVIGISKVKPIIEQMGNQTPRIYFGVETEDMTDSAKKEHQVLNGIYVNQVQANSPAFIAGMKNGDIILQVNNQAIMHTNNFYAAIAGLKPKDTISVRIKRTSGTVEKELDLEIVLEEKAK